MLPGTVLAHRTVSISCPVRVGSIEALYFGCSWVIVYFAYDDYVAPGSKDDHLLHLLHPRRPRTRGRTTTSAPRARTVDYFHCDALHFDRLRRLYFRCTTRLVE